MPVPDRRSEASELPAARPIRRLLVANRSEIAIRVFRSAHELGIRTVAIYSHEDRFALHRFKADEAYRVGKPGEPMRAYLDIDGIVGLARGTTWTRSIPVTASCRKTPSSPGPAQSRHDLRRPARGSPGKAGRQAGGPAHRPEGQSSGPVRQRRAGQDQCRGSSLADKLGLSGDRQGGDGRRRPRHARRFLGQGHSTKRWIRPAAKPARLSAVADIFLEKFIAAARHIEVQLLGDRHGNLVHLFERDCSVQRRHQKVVEIAPAPNLVRRCGRQLLEAALAVGRAVGLDNAGTVEFLLDVDSGEFYFIEVNPRIQVEHTVTEVVTGFDIVKRRF